MEHYHSGSPPADVLITGHFKEHYGYRVYRAHGSGNWLITYTLAGQGLYRQPGLSVQAQPGDVILLQPGALHDYSVPPDGSWEFLWAHFQPRLEWLSWWRSPRTDNPLWTASGQGLLSIHIASQTARERIHQAFLNLHKDASLPDAHSSIPRNGSLDESATGGALGQQSETPLTMLQRELALNSLEEVLLLAVRENLREQQQNAALDERVQFVLDLITHDLAAPHTLETLADAVALSPSRLSHLFKQEVGDSVNNLLLSLRLNKAARLLEFTTQSISTISDEVGFHSAFYFSRQFRQRFGMNPRAYRDSVEQRKP